MRRLGLALLLMAAIAVLPPAAQAQAPSLWWKLDSYSGNPNGAASTPDSSANDFFGVATLFQPIATGRFGNAMRLPEVYQQLGSGIRDRGEPPLDTASLSTVIWVRAGATPAGDRSIVTYNEACTTRAWRLRTNGGAVSFEVRGATGTATSATIPAASLWDGSWHGIAATYNGTATRIFFDGAQVGADTAGQGAIQYDPYFPGTPHGPAVGAPSQGSCANEHPVIDVDDFRMYGTALTPAQAQYLTNPFHAVSPALPVAAVAAPELAARYPLDNLEDIGQQGPQGALGHVRPRPARPGRRGHAGGRPVPQRLRVRRPGRRVPRAVQLAAGAPVADRHGVGPARSGAAGAHRTIVGKSTLGASGCDHAYALDTGDSGGVGFTVRQLSGNVQVETPEIPPAQIWDDRWHAVAGTVRNGIVTLWMDGAGSGRRA